MCSPRGGDHQKNNGLLIGTHLQNYDFRQNTKTIDFLKIGSYLPEMNYLCPLSMKTKQYQNVAALGPSGLLYFS